jgi:Transposase DDE domain
MFIDTIANRMSPPAILLRESYREGGKVKKRTLANLSKLPKALIDGIAALITGGKVTGPEAGKPEDHGFEIVRSLPHGHVAAVRGMMRKLGLGRTLQGRTQVERRIRDLIEAMIIQRIIAPGSKLAFHRALALETATSSLALSVSVTEVAEREVYAALDWLIEQQLRIEAALASKHLVDGTVVLYDVSSSYMEGRCCPFAKYGHTRDHRPDRPQIVYGLLCATDGTPIAVEVFEGDTADPKTVKDQIEKLRRRFRQSHVAIVGDRGMITSARIAEELKPAGLDWITVLGHRTSPRWPKTKVHYKCRYSTSAISPRSPRPTSPASVSSRAAIRRWPQSGRASARRCCSQQSVSSSVSLLRSPGNPPSMRPRRSGSRLAR